MQDTDQSQPSRDPPASWLEVLEQSDKELAAGQTEALEPLLAELDRSAAELERPAPELASSPPKR